MKSNNLGGPSIFSRYPTFKFTSMNTLSARPTSHSTKIATSEQDIEPLQMSTRPPTPIASSPIERTYRIRNIPNGKSHDEVLQKLWSDFKEIFEFKNPEDPEASPDLVLHPSMDGDSQVGILTLTAPADMLERYDSEREIDVQRYVTWNLRPKVTLLVDHKFRGLTPLNTCSNPQADLVAVTGLGGHPWGSWRHRKTHKMWLRDFLPDSLKDKVRIMIYGYNTELQGSSKSTARMRDFVEDFVQKVHATRKENPNRPLILVGHSLGCIIIGKALLYCRNNPLAPEYKPIHDANRLLVFFGAPHRGLNNIGIDEIIARTQYELRKRSMTDLLRILEKDSTYLEEHVGDMVSILASRTMIITVYETIPTPVPVLKLSTGRYVYGDENGEAIFRVSKDSASLNLPNEKRISREVIHSDLAKFAFLYDDSYKELAHQLNKFIDSLTITKALTTPDEHPVKGLSEEIIETRRKCRDWLKATNPSSECDTNLRHHTKGTCSWILVRKEYINLVSSKDDETHLWIRGKPGAGKSVISAFIINNLQSPCIPSPNTILPDIAVLYFFFRSGDPTKSSSPEMLRSLIDQILEYQFDRTTTMNVIREGKTLQDSERSDPCQSIKKLWVTLQAMLRYIQKSQRTVVIVLDALDECNDRQDFMDRLANSNHIGARFLITSRPEKDIIDAFHNRSKFYSVVMDVGEDIDTHVEEVIRNWEPLQVFRDQIIHTIKEKAKGMFRYAALMLEELQKPQSCKVLDVLKSMPRGLYGMYERILSQLTSQDEDHSFLKFVLLSITTAYRPMTVAEVSYAYAAQGKIYNDEFDPRTYCPITADQIRSACGSLVEITDNNELRFSHLSVQEFLLQSSSKLSAGNEQLRDYLVKPEMAHITMASICVTQLSLTVLNVQNKERSDNRREEPLRYAIIFWLLHASEVAKQDINATESERLWEKVHRFLKSKAFSEWKLQFPNWNYWHRGYCMHDSRFHPHPLTVAASYGFAYYFNNLKVQDDINTADSIGRTALSWAAINGNESIVKSLLKRHDINANTKSITGCTPLHYASAKGHKAIMEQLLRTAEVNVDIKDRLGRTPLCLAVQQQNTSAIQVLLAKKANINIIYKVSESARNKTGVGMEAPLTTNTAPIPCCST